MNGDAAQWGWQEHLLASAVDALHAANWQRAGKKNAPRPKPVRRPGAVDPNERRFTGTSRSIEELRAVLREKWSMAETEEVG